jgi:hypothetical protein
MTQERGFICGLTNKIADFENICESFRIDSKKKQEDIRKYKNEIDSNIEKFNSLAKRMVNSGPEFSYLVDQVTKSSAPPLYQLPSEMIIFPLRRKKIMNLLLGILMPFIVAKAYYDGELNSVPSWSVVFLVLMALGGFYLIYLFIENKEILRMSKLGIIVKRKQFIPWNQIDFVHFETVRSKNTTEIYLILVMGLGFGTNKRIDVTYADKDIKELGTWIYQFIRSWKTN